MNSFSFPISDFVFEAKLQKHSQHPKAAHLSAGRLSLSYFTRQHQ